MVIGLWTTLGWCQQKLQEEARPQDSAVPLDLERDSTRSPYEQEIASYEQALAVARQEKNRRGEAVALNQLGVASQRMGQYERALALHEQALTIAQQERYRDMEGVALNGLGSVYRALGQYERALAFHEQALTIARQEQGIGAGRRSAQ